MPFPQRGSSAFDVEFIKADSLSGATGARAHTVPDPARPAEPYHSSAEPLTYSPLVVAHVPSQYESRAKGSSKSQEWHPATEP